MSRRILICLLLCATLFGCAKTASSPKKDITFKTDLSINEIEQLCGGKKVFVVKNEYTNGRVEFVDNKSNKKIIAYLCYLIDEKKDGYNLIVLLLEHVGDKLVANKVFNYFWKREDLKGITMNYDKKNEWLFWGWGNSEDYVSYVWDGKEFKDVISPDNKY